MHNCSDNSHRLGDATHNHKTRHKLRLGFNVRMQLIDNQASKREHLYDFVECGLSKNIIYSMSLFAQHLVLLPDLEA